MTSTFAQRLGLDRAELPPEVRRGLLAARAAAICFLALGLLSFAAAAAGRDLRGPALIAAGATAAIALLVLCSYERLSRHVHRLIAFVATLIIAELTLFQPSGDRYAPLYLGVVIYVSSFFSRAHALAQLLMAIGLWAVAVAHVYSFGDAAQIWILGAGTLTGAAALTCSMRGRLLRAAERANAHQATLDAWLSESRKRFRSRSISRALK